MRFLILLLFFASSVSAQPLAVTNAFSNNTVADAAAINQNFADIVSGMNAKLRTDNGSPYATAVGFEALERNTGSFNTAVGLTTLSGDGAGDYNTALGAYALANNTSGGNNTANGYRALNDNTEGSYNTASGLEALRNNTVGGSNTASGIYTLYYNTEGDFNSASGGLALHSNTTGSSNTASGYKALYSNTTGSFNTASGLDALASNITGIGNTAIGFAADVTSDDLTNATAIGYNAQVVASNMVRIGNDTVAVIGGAAAWSNFSDKRLKEDIEPVDTGISLINDLKPVVYHRINNDEPDVEMGLLAQEVEATLEKHGLGNSGMVHQPTEDSPMSLRYNDLLAPMIKAIQELDDASEAKDEQIALLEQKFNSQQEELLAIVESQQEQIAQLQRMVEHQLAMN